MTSALVLAPERRFSSYPPIGSPLPLNHSSGVPKFLDRSRVATSSPLKPRFRMTRSCFGKRACNSVSSHASYCMRSASVLPMIQMWSPTWRANGSAARPRAGIVLSSASVTANTAPERSILVMVRFYSGVGVLFTKASSRWPSQWTVPAASSQQPTASRLPRYG